MNTLLEGLVTFFDHLTENCPVSNFFRPVLFSLFRVEVVRFTIIHPVPCAARRVIANQAILHLAYKVTERVYYVTLLSPPVADDLMNLQWLHKQRNKILALNCETRTFDE